MREVSRYRGAVRARNTEDPAFVAHAVKMPRRPRLDAEKTKASKDDESDSKGEKRSRARSRSKPPTVQAETRTSCSLDHF